MRSRLLSVLAAAALVTVSVSAAPVQLRVFLDADRDVATGCASSGFSGAERVVSATVDLSASGATVSNVATQTCSAGVLGAATPIAGGAGAASYGAASGQMLAELGVPWSSLDLGATPSAIHLGYFAQLGAATDSVFTSGGGMIVYPVPTGRRRVVGISEYTITVDGNGTDWGGLAPLAPGSAAGGPGAVRLENVFAHANATTLWFRIDAKVSADAPVALDDAYTVRQGKAVTIPTPGVLANDSDPNNKPLSATVATPPAHGTVNLATDGGFTYVHDGTPEPGDSFEYKASNGTEESNKARVALTVTPNGAPDANNDSYSVAHRGTLTVAQPGVLGNDSDPDGDTIRAVLVAAPRFGTLTLAQNGSFTYTHNGSNTLADSFTYRASDGTSQSSSARVTITIGADQPPVGFAESYTVAEGATLNVAAPGVLGNDSDPDTPANLLVATVATNPAHGTLTLNANGSFTYVHDGSETTTDSFTYTVGDGILTSAPVTVSITVTPVNDAPIAINDNYTTNEDTPLTVPAAGVLANDSDAENNAITATLVANAANGSVVLNANGGFTYTPNANFNGTDTFTYTANDAGGPSNVATVTITVTAVNDVPAFTAGGNVTIAENLGAYSAPWASAISAGPPNEAPQALNFLVANDNNALFSVQPAISSDGTLTFTTSGNAIGSATVTVQLHDNGGTANGGVDTTGAVTFTINVTCAPIAVTNPSISTGTAGVAFSQTFTQTGAVGGATFTLASGALPAGLTLATNGTLSGTPTVTGTFPITVTVTSGQGCTGTSATYNLTIACPTITITNPATTSGPAGSPFSATFTQTGGVGTTNFTLASGTLPTGLTLATNGVLSGTPSQGGTFPITVTATDANGCTGTSATYTLTIICPAITVTNPVNANGTANAAFNETFTQSGGVGTPTFTLASGTLPAGLTLAPNGVLSGTPTQTGTFPITVTATDANGCTGTGATYTIAIACQTISVTNPGVTSGTANAAFSQTFTQTGGIGTTTFTVASGTLPNGLTLAPNGTLSGTPTQTGSFPITVKATDSNGCNATGATYTLTIACQTITVNNPGVTSGTANAAFSQTFTASNAIGTTTFSTASTLPNGLTLAADGTLSGTPTQTGTFPIVVTATDANTCTGTGATYTLTINCQTISVTNPANTTGTVNAPFSEQFTQSGAIGTATFTTASTLPTGLTLSTSGLLSGTPMQSGNFPIVVTVTDSNGCTGTSATYNLVVNCQAINVTNPSSNSEAAGTPLVAANFTFTQTGAIGGATFTTASTLPTGVALSTAGVLTGTPSQGGTFPITVTVTDGNGCTGASSGYTLTITCPVITVTSPANSNGTAGVAFSEQFTQSGGNGTITWSVDSGTLPAGITMNPATGILSGTTNAAGTFPITVTATDSNGCTGTSATYNLTINCQTVSVTNPGVSTGTVDAAFSQTFTATGILGTVTWSETGSLPAGVTLDASTGVLSGTPTVPGSFPITVKATDTNGCFSNSSYTLTISCQTITVTNPGVNTGTVDAPFSQTVTQTGAHGTATFSTSSTLPAGLTLDSAGLLSGTPTVKGSFPIVVTVTDSNGCTGIEATYTLTIGCQTITVTNPGVASGTVGAAFSQSFTQTGAHASASFTTASTLPAGLTLATDGTLSGTPMQPGTFPIVVTVTDANGCTGTGATYTLVIGCQTISVTNPSNASGTVASAFTEQFTQTGAVGTATFTTASTLPNGLSLATDGTLSGTPTQSGTFPIVVTVTDSNGCTGTGATYTLVIGCQTITVNTPVNTAGTANASFNESFTQTNAQGTATFTLASGTLPAGLTLATDGTLSGIATQTGSFPITVQVTDSNGCTGTSATYTIVIACQTITITSPSSNSTPAGASFTPASNWTFSAGNAVGSPTWTLASGTLPNGVTLSSGGVLTGAATQTGSFPITVTATDANGCTATSGTYTLTVTCPVITPARNGGGAFPAGTINSAYTGQSVTASGGTAPYTFAVTSGALPTGLSLDTNTGAISGTPTATGTFTFTVTATDASTVCSGSQSFSIAINPSCGADSYSNLVNNTQAAVTGGSTASPTTPFVGLTGTLIANDAPAGGVAAVAGTFATTQGGSITIAADGTFLYTPPVTGSPLASDTYTYTITSNTGATATPTQATGTITFSLANRVWYVKNNAVAGGNGQSQSPFNSTANFTNGARSTPDTAGDILYIFRGDGTTTNLNNAVVLLDNEQLIGEGVALVVNSNTLVAAGSAPQLTSAGNDILIGNGNTIRGVTTTGGINGIAGSVKAALTVGNVTLQNATGAGISLNGMTGAVTFTNTTVSNNAIGLSMTGGTPALTMNNTNSITANAGQRSINLSNLAATAVLNLAVPITDNGLGISIANSASGASISFLGTQVLATTSNTAVSLNTNAGATIGFSGNLGITTTTGSGFVATGGGTLNLAGPVNVTTGAAATGVNLNGMTVGAGVTFTTVNTTGASTGIALTNVSGTVNVNGGTITNGTTGVSLQGATTNLSLLNVTITGPTTGITNTTNFGTLTIGASVSVSAVTALNLTTGTVSGTFANVSSTGGTNGVNLNAVSGTWGTTGGSLTGATGATFNVAGSAAAGSAITWGGTITQNNGATAVTISGHNRSVTFSGNITTGGTSTGISIGTSSGTYLFNGTNTIAGSGGGIAIGASESGTITFSNSSSINTAGTAFSVAGGGGAVTAVITYGGTITKNSGGVLISVDNLDSPGTLAMSHTPAASGNITQNNNGANGISVINSSSANITISDASVTFNNAAAGFTASGNTGGTINLPGLALTGSGNKAGMLISGGGTINVNAGAANPSINLSGGSAAASRAIDGATAAFSGTLNLTNVTITGNGNADIVNLGGGTLGGSGSSISGANRALVLSGVALTNGAGMASVTSSGGANGISLTSVTGGPYTIGGGSLTANTGSSFLVSGGSSTVTFAGTITQSVANQRVVDIQNATGGAMNFTGAISSTTGGFFANGNANTAISFRGGLSLSTGANAAFTSTAGGGTSTIEVCDENPCNNAATGALVNTLTTTTGTALNVANSNITANNLEFRSISAGTAASGPANAVILNTTSSSGGLKIKGTGAAGSGGTIQKTTSDSIVLTSTQKVSLSFMNVQTSAESGILGTTVTDLTLTGCSFTNNGDDSGDCGIKITNLGGTAAWTDLSVTGSALANVLIDNTSSALTSLTVTGNSHFDSLGTAFGGNAFLLEIRGTATLGSGSINGATFQNNKPARGITVQSQDTASIGDAVSNAFVVMNCTFTNNGLHASFEQSGSASITFKFLNNGSAGSPMTMPNTPVGTSHAVNVFSSSTSTGGAIRGRINGNFIGNSAVAGSGSAIGNGIRVFIQGKTQSVLQIDNNTIRQIPQARGIDVQFVGQMTVAQPIVQHDITVTNNDVNPQDSTGFPAAAIYLAADNQGSPARMRSDVRGNTVPAGAAIDTFPTFLIVDEVVATADTQLVDTAPASATCTAQLTSMNTGSASAAPGCTLIAGPLTTPP